jgi:predicted RNase H-like HicB family nuclease
MGNPSREYQGKPIELDYSSGWLQRTGSRILRRMQLPVVLRPGEDGWIVAECPVIPGCISQGRTREEALANIQEAIELCLETRAQEGWTLPSEYEVVDVIVAA